MNFEVRKRQHTMRIGIMLRAIDERGGIGIYTRNITEELLVRDPKNEYTLFYKSKENLGRFAQYANVIERCLTAPSKVIWDQVNIPLACREEKIDVVFRLPVLG